MHDEALEFVRKMLRQYPDHAKGKILELGSRFINGSVRTEFPDAAHYVGVDVYDGPNVDVVGLAHEVDLPDKDFDVVICTEMLEHDPFWWVSLLNGLDHLKSGGLLIMTCAGPSRGPHDEQESPTPGYYANVSADQIKAWATRVARLENFHVDSVRGDADTHLWVIKA